MASVLSCSFFFNAFGSTFNLFGSKKLQVGLGFFTARGAFPVCQFFYKIVAFI